MPVKPTEVIVFLGKGWKIKDNTCPDTLTSKLIIEAIHQGSMFWVPMCMAFNLFPCLIDYQLIQGSVDWLIRK